jgi:Na+/proline symporter
VRHRNNERSGRIGQTYGSFVKRLCTIGWALVGLIVAALVIKDGVLLDDPEMAFGYGCRRLLLPGLTGLMVSALVAANMSACSNYMVNTGALFTENVYKKYLNPLAEDKKILWIEFLELILSLLSVVFALTIKNAARFLFTETICICWYHLSGGSSLEKSKQAWGFGCYCGIIHCILCFELPALQSGITCLQMASCFVWMGYARGFDRFHTFQFCNQT